MILLEELPIRARVPDLEHGGWREARLLRRTCPVFGTGSRLIEGAKLTAAGVGLEELAAATSGFCPFCAEVIEQATAPFEEGISPTGRIRHGTAWVVPNVLAYSAVSAVGVYDPARHVLGLEDFTPDLLFDAFGAMLEHARAVRRLYPELVWSSISANYLPPSGSSLLHPHLQSSHDPVPLAAQAILESRSEVHWTTYGASLLGELVELERAATARYVASTGPWSWVTPFAPSGFYEVWGVHEELADLVALDDHDRRQLAAGLASVLGAYRERGLSSFNYQLLGAGPRGAEVGVRLLVRIVARTPAAPWYRSDVTYFEKLGMEAMIDHTPESFAEELRAAFGTGIGA
jgi:UDPglucose--hexose-1-phosphate uridylyltransferase